MCSSVTGILYILLRLKTLVLSSIVKMKVLDLISQQKLIVATITGVAIGIISGLTFKHYSAKPWSSRDIMYLKFPGELFMRMVNCLIMPLVTSSIISATYYVTKSGSVGKLALYYYTTTTTLGITLCIVLSQTIRPGELLRDHNFITNNSTTHFVTVDAVLDLFRNMIPDNILNASLTQHRTVLELPSNLSVPIEEWEIKEEYVPGTNVLGLVFFSLLLGVAIASMDLDPKPVLHFFECLSQAMILIMSRLIIIAPICIAFLISAKVLEVEDFSSIIKRLGIYIFTVFLGLVIQGLLLLPLVYFVTTRKSPYKIISKLGPAFATAIGTSSSTATVPMTLKCLDEIGIDPNVSRFILPIGATINMDGIALYETIGALFIIQLRGLEFPLLKIIVISITCTVSCIGAATLPNGGYAMLIMVLNSVGVPVEDVSLIIAIDWFVDRFRTTINVIADALGAGIVAHYHQKDLVNPISEEEMKPLNSQAT